MKYTVVITPSAEENIAQSFRYIRNRSRLNAERWLLQLLDVVHELENFAGHGRARESDFLHCDLRQKVFKSHRIIYSVDKTKKVVTVHYVRHGARRAVGEPDGDSE